MRSVATRRLSRLLGDFDLPAAESTGRDARILGCVWRNSEATSGGLPFCSSFSSRGAPPSHAAWGAPRGHDRRRIA